MSIKSQLKKDLLMLTTKVNASLKEEGKKPLRVRFKRDEILIREEGQREDKEVKMDLDLIIYKLINGEDAFEFFISFLKKFDMLSGAEKMSWEAYRHFVLPIVKNINNPTSFGDQENEDVMLTMESDIPETRIFFVVDEEAQMFYLTQSMIEDFGISKEEVIREAYQNLNVRYEFDLEYGGMTNRKSLKSATMDGFDATRLLNLNFDKVSELVGPDYFFLIPERDLLLIVEKGDSSSQIIAEFKSLANRAFTNSRYGVSPLLYQYNEGKIEVLKV